jgi:LDH2 family malate/lactate/ureidoglycolate dehydrogenase
MAGNWALRIAGDDMIGFSCSNTSAIMPPVGARKPGIGNNPFSFAYSGSKYREICVDMASSTVAIGKALDLAVQGKPVPEGWLLDREGRPTTDFYKMGMVLPFAGHKGFGIAFVVETFATFLSGGTLTPDMNPQQGSAQPELASHSFGAIKISTFRDLAEFRNDVDSYIDFIKSLPLQDDVKSVKYPGEIELAIKQQILKEGIGLPETLIRELSEFGVEAGVSVRDTAFLTERKQ